MAAQRQTGYWLDLGLTRYAPAFGIQEQILQARLDGRLAPTVILQENLPIFTIGRSGSRDNILSSPQDLEQRGIEVLEVNRGGDVTYHGPGQLIVSPLLYLGDIGLNANQYLHRLEDVLIDLLAGYDIHAGKKAGLPGVWHGEAKIAAVGIAVKHGHTFHGFSLNLKPDLAAFNLINPCGVSQMPVTSIRQVLGQSPPMAQIKARLREILHNSLALETRTTTWSDLARNLNR
ncbi:Octanoate-[acyl-carrier-protein]-protein-N-octanoyltransferase (EC [Olavius sp. associated proteobacterium Delta 1]|nr:Octanoate-[acyl-carrier-protein]-protein-N-octanoyltransferase (EC [Olavius sp. associated proteobacterium Delta 1]